MYTSLEKMQHLRTLSRGSHVPSDLALLRMVNPMAAQGLSPVETQKESILLALLEVCTLEEILSNRKAQEETFHSSIEQEANSHSDAPGGDEEAEPSEEALTVQPQEANSHSEAPGGDEEAEPSEEALTVQPQEANSHSDAPGGDEEAEPSEEAPSGDEEAEPSEEAPGGDEEAEPSEEALTVQPQEANSHSDAPSGDEEAEPSEEAPTVQPQEETKKNSPKRKNTPK